MEMFDAQRFADELMLDIHDVAIHDPAGAS
jgi:hypothetical protein